MLILLMVLAAGGLSLLLPLLLITWRRQSWRRILWGPYPAVRRRPWGPRPAPVHVWARRARPYPRWHRGRW